MAVALILMFFLSANAWADGDSSMAWYVILCLVFVGGVLLFSN